MVTAGKEVLAPQPPFLIDVHARESWVQSLILGRQAHCNAGNNPDMDLLYIIYILYDNTDDV